MAMRVLIFCSQFNLVAVVMMPPILRGMPEKDRNGKIPADDLQTHHFPGNYQSGNGPEDSFRGNSYQWGNK
jgi:hypothetical protein